MNAPFQGNPKRQKGRKMVFVRNGDNNTSATFECVLIGTSQHILERRLDCLKVVHCESHSNS